MEKSTLRTFFKVGALPPFLAGVLDMGAGLIYSEWFLKTHSLRAIVLWIVARLAWSAFLIFITRYPPVLSKICHWFAVVFFTFGLTVFLLISDQASSFGVTSWVWYVLLLAGAVIPSLSFFAIPSVTSELVFMARPQMRLGTAMILFGVAGAWAAASAVITYTLYPPAWWWLPPLFASIVSGLGALLGWWWYVREEFRSICLASMLMVWLMLQVGLVLLLWPIGFLFAGWLAAWVWYILWLTMRYALSEEGISMPRHAYFLGMHSFLFILCLFAVVRWK